MRLPLFQRRMRLRRLGLLLISELNQQRSRGLSGVNCLVLLSALPQHCKSRRASESGVKGEAVISYRNPLIPPTAGKDLKSSGFPTA